MIRASILYDKIVQSYRRALFFFLPCQSLGRAFDKDITGLPRLGKDWLSVEWSSCQVKEEAAK